MLGYATVEYYNKNKYSVFALSRKDFNIGNDDFQILQDYLIANEIDVIINCAGVIKPRISSLSMEEVIYVNSIFPRNLARFAKNHNLFCFHITTDCVYSGIKGNYSESDLFDPDDVYGLTKCAGEPKDCMILRTSIIGEEKNSDRSLLEWARGQKGNEVNGFIDHQWNGVTTLYLAEIIESILNNDLYQEGLFHIHSPESVNKYELLKFIDNYYKLNLKINAIKSEKTIDRTLSTIHDISGKVCLVQIEKQIEDMYAFFN